MIEYEHVVSRLLDAVPELGEAYEHELEWWKPDAPGPYIVYEDILNPLINRLLESPLPETEGTLKKIFAFIDLLARSTDDRVRELVAVGICQHLVADHIRLSRARRFFGPATQQIVAMVQRS